MCGFYVLPTVAKKPMRPEMLSLIEEGIRIQRDPRKFARPFKRIIRNDVSEFESHMPSHAVDLCRVRSLLVKNSQAAVMQGRILV
jgi:hypothetical protein